MTCTCRTSKTVFLLFLIVAITGIILRVTYTNLTKTPSKILENWPLLSVCTPTTPLSFICLDSGLAVTSSSSVHRKGPAKWTGNSNKSDQHYGIEYKSSCSCDGYSASVDLDSSAKKRRQIELKDWIRQGESSRPPLMMCESFSPFRYPAGGITIPPLSSTYLHGLALNNAAAGFLPDDKLVKIEIRCRHSRGVLTTDSMNSKTEVIVSGKETSVMTVEGNKAQLQTINSALANIEYKSIVYDTEERDVVDIKMFNFNISIHIHIKRPVLPILYDPGPSADINSKVTIITKTFERYDALNRLISSIHKFYPDMTIIVADDSEFPVKINLPNVKQYAMPYGEGYFAGRNLALSQVRTKYFVSVDDDYIFTVKTRLENFIEKFEHPDVKVDLIGGAFSDDKNGKESVSFETECYGCHVATMYYKDENSVNNGDCYSQSLENKYSPSNVFPNCFIADSVDNFFMARTSTVRSVGFDPIYVGKFGHSNFFMDGLGKLRVMECTDVVVQRKQDNTNVNGGDKDKRSASLRHTMFKYNLKCVERK
ncbi:beta-1,4 N-acetylgalactosaminyltransferase 1-like [Glandiceps talaboti]